MWISKNIDNKHKTSEPNSVVWGTLEDLSRHPKTGWQFSIGHSPEQFPAQWRPKVPGAQEILQDEP